MPGLFRSFFPTPERTGQRLHRDAIAIIDSDQRNGSTEYLNRVHELTRKELDNLKSRLSKDPDNPKSITYDIKQKHQEARRHRDNALLTATTLALIYQQANELGEPGHNAIAVIDNFLTQPVLRA
jgi:hypothetical protein